MATGKAPLDHRDDAHRKAQVSPYVDTERRQGAQVSRKEMQMTRRPRDEDDSTRTARFVDIERDKS